MTNIAKSIITGFVFGIIIGIYLSIKNNLTFGVVVGSFCTISLAFISYFRIFSRIDSTIPFQNIDKKMVIYYGLASHFKDGISVGGKLSLTNNQIVFQSNLMSFIKRNETVIEIENIQAVRFEDSYTPFKNGLSITTNEGTENFIVNRRGIWIEEIRKTMSTFREQNF